MAKKQTAHAALVEEAREALAAVFGDSSVSQTQTLESLEELKDEIENYVEGIEEDLKLG